MAEQNPSRYHSKYHRKNHHTLSTEGYPDSALDPIASPSEPFKGSFNIIGDLNLSGNIVTSSYNLNAINNILNAHISNVNNPHTVTKDQVGLSNVDNISLDDILSSSLDYFVENFDSLSSTALSSIIGDINLLSSSVVVNSNDILNIQTSLSTYSTKLVTCTVPELVIQPGVKIGDYAYCTDVQSLFTLTGYPNYGLSSWAVINKKLTTADISGLPSRISEIDTYPVNTNLILYTLSTDYLKTDGSNNMSNSLNMNYNSILNLGIPIDDNSAISKGYVDIYHFGNAEDGDIYFDGTTWTDGNDEIESYADIAEILLNSEKYGIVDNVLYILSSCNFGVVDINSGNIRIRGEYDNTPVSTQLKIKDRLSLVDSHVYAEPIGINQYNSNYGKNFEGYNVTQAITIAGPSNYPTLIYNEIGESSFVSFSQGGNGGIGGILSENSFGDISKRLVWNNTDNIYDSHLVVKVDNSETIQRPKNKLTSGNETVFSYGLPGLMGAPGALYGSGISGYPGLGGYAGGYIDISAYQLTLTNSIIHANGSNGTGAYYGQISNQSSISCGGGGGGGGSGGYVKIKTRSNLDVNNILLSIDILGGNGGSGGAGAKGTSFGQLAINTTYTNGTYLATNISNLMIRITSAGQTASTLPNIVAQIPDGKTIYTTGTAKYVLFDINGKNGNPGQSGHVQIEIL